MDPLGLVKGPFALPELYEIEQRFDVTQVEDIQKAVFAALEESGASSCLRPGARIAVTAGSRGIRNNVRILRAAVDWLKAKGASPFVIGAMGSHGGGTAVGQKELLHSLGVTDESVGCPVVTSDDTTLVGITGKGHKVYCDSIAFESDGIVLINRVKPHTSFRGPIESGLCKSMTVGLGKVRGATYVHMLGSLGMVEAIPSMAEVFLASRKVTAGVAILENAFDETAEIIGLHPSKILATEPSLLERAKAMMPSLPADKVDVLVVGEMGKNFSGTGMDTNILGRFRLEELPDPESPKIKRVVVLDLSPESHGNATGTGLADVITTRIAEAYDRKSSYLNCLTSTFLGRAAIPPAMDNDWAAIGLAASGIVENTKELRLMMIKNTLHVDRLYVSGNLLEQVKSRPWVRVVGGPVAIEFGRDHNLTFPSLGRH
ncbi:MAG: lactate racemase domain-containing protein [Bacillota bacterium]|nr:lactate racemase domain-containing protein [Bacillota bacterium]